MSTKKNTNKFINTIDECLTNGVKNGIFQVSLEDQVLNGREVTINGSRVINFGSCSYLGLEVDDRLKQGAIDATLRYGTQYSSSRLFSACNLYDEIEDLFYKLFDNNPAILAATTTLAHLGALPILVHDEDLIILDHQVHGSVQLAVQQLKARGNRVEMIKHNRMDMLEDLIGENPNKYNKIWYMADGLYSMYGDYAPLKDLVYLLEKYPTFHVYVDDAHGMSWTGRHGNGYVLSQTPLHPKMVLTTSLAKGFGTGGGVTVMADKEMMRKIRTCGSSYTYSGPVQPPMLGASIASAKIHLTDEIYSLQSKLAAKISLTRSIIDQYELPLVLPSDSPIFYIGLGLPRVGYNMVQRLLREGFYTNIGIFPGVPVKCCGLRLAITNGQREEDIKNVLDAFQYHFPRVLEEEGQSVEDISSNFQLPFEKSRQRYPKKEMQSAALDVQHEKTIHQVDATTWDHFLGANGTFDWEGCRFLEESYSGNPEPENNWKFHYLIIRDKNKKPVLATFFTELLCKDDMIAPSAISEQIEEIRKTDRYYLTSNVLMMGSLLTVGNHLFIDKQSPYWREAMLEMIRIMNREKEKCGAATIQLRDFDSNDEEMSAFLGAEGFIKVAMPDAHTIHHVNAWNSIDEYISSLSVNGRRNLKKTVLKNMDDYEVRLRKSVSVEDHALEGSPAGEITSDDVNYWYELYMNVKRTSYTLNTFNVPVKLFETLVKHPNWDILELRLKSGTATRPVAVVFCYLSSSRNFSPFMIGLDYDYVISHGCYRQGIFQSVLRANQLKCTTIYLGMDASVEKRKFGSKAESKSVFVQASDNYNMELIETVYHKQTKHEPHKRKATHQQALSPVEMEAS